MLRLLFRTIVPYVFRVCRPKCIRYCMQVCMYMYIRIISAVRIKRIGKMPVFFAFVFALLICTQELSICNMHIINMNIRMKYICIYVCKYVSILKSVSFLFFIFFYCIQVVILPLLTFFLCRPAYCFVKPKGSVGNFSQVNA